MDTVLDRFLKDYMPNEDDDYKALPLGSKMKNQMQGSSKVDTTDYAKIQSSLNFGEVKATTDKHIAQLDAKKASETSQVAGDIGNAALTAAPAALDMISNLKGQKYDTSAEGGGVGGATGNILTSGSQAAMAGFQIGGPIGAGVGAVLGAGTALIGNNKAKKEYARNRKNYNIAESTIESMQREDEYRYSQGMEMINDLKSLREKQLGFLR